MVGVRKPDVLISAKVRAMAEMIGAGRNEAPRTKAHTMLKIPLEEIGEDGINLGISETGTHFCIKI